MNIKLKSINSFDAWILNLSFGRYFQYFSIIFTPANRDEGGHIACILYYAPINVKLLEGGGEGCV